MKTKLKEIKTEVLDEIESGITAYRQFHTKDPTTLVINPKYLNGNYNTICGLNVILTERWVKEVY